MRVQYLRATMGEGGRIAGYACAYASRVIFHNFRITAENSKKYEIVRSPNHA